MFSMLSMSVVHSILLLLTSVVLSVLVAPMWLLFSMVLLVASSVILILLAGIRTEVMISLPPPMVFKLLALLLASVALSPKTPKLALHHSRWHSWAWVIPKVSLLKTPATLVSAPLTPSTHFMSPVTP